MKMKNILIPTVGFLLVLSGVHGIFSDTLVLENEIERLRKDNAVIHNEFKRLKDQCKKWNSKASKANRDSSYYLK